MFGDTDYHVDIPNKHVDLPNNLSMHNGYFVLFWTYLTGKMRIQLRGCYGLCLNANDIMVMQPQNWHSWVECNYFMEAKSVSYLALFWHLNLNHFL